MAKFRFSTPGGPKPDSPTLLFRDLKRDPSIKFLWDHQARLLDEYHSHHLKTRDLAIELPTGSGKTLVALLIAEYRRRAFGERVAFMCPTRQLCNQVAAQTGKYGIQASLLVGKQRDYDRSAFLAYQQAKAIAVTTYSGVFNSNPSISDAQLLICDDAHAADNYVASKWTVRISRQDKAAFAALAQILAPHMSEGMLHQIENYDGGRPNRHVDLISQISISDLDGQIRQIFDANSADSEWRYAWETISQHLDACALYCSAECFEIRPVIAPTLTHAPFKDAQQRLYMSATLGEDGGIERSFGVDRISRLPMPTGWDKRGTGRRLVLFPSYGLDDSKAWETIIALNKLTKRGLVLVPDDKSKEELSTVFRKELNVLSAQDVEQSLTPFVNSTDNVALIVANRWEGIDLPGEDCRLLALIGLPKGAGLQERFLMDKLGAGTLLRDRIRTRVTQAMGRCTRDEADYAIVLLIGNELLKWCCTTVNTGGMHPELQAEIAFGLENSEGRTAEDFVELCQAFLDGSEDWHDAEATIAADRQNRSKLADPAANALSKVAALEIQCIYRMWNAEFSEAYTLATQVISGLEGGGELRPYRCFWHHQAAVAAFLAGRSTQNKTLRTNAAHHLEMASTTSLGIKWFGKLRSQLSSTTPSETPDELPVREWFVNLNALLTNWGIKGSKFEREVTNTRNLLSDPSNAKGYERGLSILGSMLGAHTYQWNADGAPDGLWVYDQWNAFVFEAKCEKAKLIPLKTVRQALTHEERVRTDKLIHSSVPCATVVIPTQTAIDPIAHTHAGSLFVASPDHVLTLLDRASKALRIVRARATGISEEMLQAEAEQTYKEEKIFMTDVADDLKSKKLADMPKN